MSPPALELDEVTVKMDGRVVLDRLSLSVDPGSSTALIGHVGGGKTTILRLLAGLVQPVSGHVRVAGRDLGTLSYEAMRAHRIRTGYAFESSGLVGNMTVADNIALALRYHDRGRVGEAAILERVGDIASELGIADELGEPSHRVNASVRKRALIGRALALAPSLLLCDEPQVGLTLKEAQRVSRALERRRREHGMTMLIADHDGYLEPFIVDRQLYLENGRLLARPSMRPPTDRYSDHAEDRVSLTIAEIYRGVT